MRQMFGVAALAVAAVALSGGETSAFGRRCAGRGGGCVCHAACYQSHYVYQVYSCLPCYPGQVIYSQPGYIQPGTNPEWPSALGGKADSGRTDLSLDTRPSPGGGGAVDQVIELTNRERVSKGLPALKSNATLNQIAQAYADKMAVLGSDRLKVLESTMGADGSSALHSVDGTTLVERGKRGGYAGGVGENVGFGHTPAQMVNWWMNSPLNRANILDQRKVGYTEIGVGRGRMADGSPTWVQLFGVPNK